MILHNLQLLRFEKSHSVFQLIFKETELKDIAEYEIFEKILFCTQVSTINLGLNAIHGAAGNYLGQQGSIYEEILLSSTKVYQFCCFNAFFKKQKLKGTFSNNLGQNIRRLFHFLAQFNFTTNETELDHYHQNVNLRVASRSAERLKTYDLTELETFEENT